MKLAAVIKYGGVLLTIPITVYVPTFMKYSYRERSLRETIFDVCFVIIGVLLQCFGFYEAYVG